MSKKICECGTCADVLAKAATFVAKQITDGQCVSSLNALSAAIGIITTKITVDSLCQHAGIPNDQLALKLMTPLVVDEINGVTNDIVDEWALTGSKAWAAIIAARDAHGKAQQEQGPQVREFTSVGELLEHLVKQAGKKS